MATLDYKMYDIFEELQTDKRWDYLTILILRANKRLRCWPAMRTIAKKAYPGKTAESAGNLGMATKAKKWLLAHGAITLVKPEHRIGAEKKLARNRHVYQLTGVVIIDKKVYPYLYISGNEHVSGDETIGDEDVSGDEISGDEISGDEISGDETNQESVVSGISSDQESVGNQESSSSKSDDEDDDNFNLTDEDIYILTEVFGSITSVAKKGLRKDRERTIRWAEYVMLTRRCYDDDDPRYVQNPSRYMFTIIDNDDAVPDLPVETDERKQKREAAEAQAKMTPKQIETVNADELKYNNDQKAARMLQLRERRENVKVSDNVTSKTRQQWDGICSQYPCIADSLMLVDCDVDTLTIVELEDTRMADRMELYGGIRMATEMEGQIVNRRQWLAMAAGMAMAEKRAAKLNSGTISR